MRFSPDMTLLTCRSGNLGLLKGGLILALMMLSACSNVPQELEVKTVQQEQIQLPPERPPIPNPQPISLRPIEWFVLTPDRLPETNDWVYFAITPETYESMALNQAEVLRFVRETMWRFQYYRGELDTPEVSVNE